MHSGRSHSNRPTAASQQHVEYRCTYFTGLPSFPQFVSTLARLSGLTMTAQRDRLTALVRRSSHRLPS